MAQDLGGDNDVRTRHGTGDGDVGAVNGRGYALSPRVDASGHRDDRHRTRGILPDNAAQGGLKLRIAQVLYVLGVVLFGAVAYWAFIVRPRQTPADAIDRQIDSTTKAIVRAGSPRPTLWRPPFGATNARVERYMIHKGYQTALWRIDSRDYANVGRPDVVERNVLTEAYDGGVVLLHDGHTPPVHDNTSLHALATIIVALKARGYCFGSLYEPSRRRSIDTSEWGMGRVKISGRACPRIIALTFDDGPDPVVTPQVLDVLKRYGVRATFFVVGVKAVRQAKLVRREAREGHVVGNHSWDHPDFTKLMPATG
jgi:peptidoglycan/xylan/chitin deacetylase (PgdA/CDA1 family)